MWLNKKEKVIIYGAGNTSQLVFKNICGLIEYVSFFVDNFRNIKDFFGKPVITEDVLLSLYQGEIIVLSSVTLWEEIREKLEFKGIKKDKILGMSDFIAWCLQNDDVQIRPLNIRIESSSLCQLNCTTCYMRLNDYGAIGKGYLKADNYKNLLQRDKYIDSVELSNNGEPFLNPDLVQVFEISKDQGVSITISNGTNFNDVTKEQLEAMVANQVKEVVLSIDGASQDTYSVYRRGGNFEKVIANIRFFNQVKERYNSELPKLRWQYILMEHNECDIEKALGLAADLDAEISFKLDWSGNYVPQNKELVRKLTGLNVYNRAEYKHHTGKEYATNACWQMVFQPQINWDGRLLGCCGNYQEDWNINVFETGLLKALNSTTYRNAVIALLTGSRDEKLYQICKSCNGNVFKPGRQLLI